MKPNKLNKFLLKQRESIITAYQRFSLLEDPDLIAKPKDGWSVKEIIGHLIDSASNNHQRFVRAQFSKDLVFQTYQQDEWVKKQQYQDMDWTDLITLWTSFNLMLTHVVAAISNEDLTRPRTKHNLHKTAFKPINADEQATLEYFIKDYYAHMQHHLKRLNKLTAAYVRQ